jgi:REP-associated tyrosine transposase
MARQIRVEYPGAFYHVTSRGNERKSIFRSKQDREKFLEYLQSASERYGAIIHAYCLMDNHYHILIETPDGNLSRIMQHINGAYTTYYNVKRQRSGHLFQGRFKAVLVQMDEYAKELSRYIHLNPVRAKMVARPEEYAWSSYTYYASEKKAPAWLNRSFILGYFGKKLITSQRKYKTFVERMLDKEYRNPLSDIHFSLVLGSSDFAFEIKDKFLKKRKHTKDRNLPLVKGKTARPTLKQIIKLIDTRMGARHKLARPLKLYFCHRYSGLKLSEIGTYFKISDSGVTQASRRVETRMAKDRQLRKQIDAIKAML